MKKQHLPTLYQQYIHLSRYARWLPEENRRETWPETVNRYFDFFEKHLAEKFKYTITPAIRNKLSLAVLDLKVMPSMRCLMTAGPALDKDHTAGYNCSYVAIDSTRAFDEIMYILMCGCGVGFSVESKYVDQLPVIAESFHETDTTIIVADSRLGWAKSFKEMIHLLYAGQVPRWDISRVRGPGAPLKTFGGRASGPDPLVDVFKFAIKMFRSAAGRKLTSIECHDLICKIAEVVVVGGVRRSALISLSDLNDYHMRDAKSGQWWLENPQRTLANNSYVLKNKSLEIGTFMNEWLALYISKSGERGIFSRYASKVQAARNGRRDVEHDFGVNPCSEIILRSREFCNLSEIVVRADDTLETLTEKTKIATMLSTFQSTLTDFKYITKKWKENCEEERLLGVSMTGVKDHPILYKVSPESEQMLNTLRNIAIATNVALSKDLKINPSTAITCMKPSGTVSQLVDSASGIHSRHSQYYVRTVRGDKKDPLAKMMVEMGFPVEDDVIKPDQVYVFSFPIAANESVERHYRGNESAVEQLEYWKMFQEHWCEHKPSITVSVKEDEWLDVGAWVYSHLNIMSGVSFLPMSDHNYKQAPYQECTKAEYEQLLQKMPNDVDWSKLSDYEKTDNTTSSKELACTVGVCEIVDTGVIT